jgi:hypothetical protein
MSDNMELLKNMDFIVNLMILNPNNNFNEVNKFIAEILIPFYSV